MSPFLLKNSISFFRDIEKLTTNMVNIIVCAESYKPILYVVGINREVENVETYINQCVDYYSFIFMLR
jgi:hypothetical protein